jgi:CubicO group peptidase (beta-lactamase class C family)
MRLEVIGWALAASAIGGPLCNGADSDRRAQVDAIFAEYQRTDSPGCALGVFREGAIEYARGYGMANLELGVAITPSTVFDIGSTSKQFSAFAVLLLEQDGKLDIDDDVRKYVPELPHYGPTITIRHLMQHTSGLRDYLELFYLGGVHWKDVTTSQDALEAIVRQKALNFEPGDEYLYSNSGFFLLSEIVKRVSGKTLAELARDRIFAPLGMRHTRYLDDPQDIVPNRSTGYDRTDEGELEIEMSDFEQTGDGAVNTTVEDLFLWDQNFYHPHVGTAEILARMQTPGTLQSGKLITYGLGLVMRDHRGLRAVSHGGSWAGYRAELLRFPDQALAVACLCNLGGTNPSELARKVAEVYLGSQMMSEDSPAPAAFVTLSESELQSRAGTYWDRLSGDYLFLSPKDGKLLLESGGSSTSFRPLSTTRFAAESTPSVELSFEGETLAFKRREETQSFSRIEPWKPTPSQLEELRGRYRSEEIAGSIEVDVEEGALVLRHRTIPPDPLKPTRGDSFYLDGLSLSFTRDAAGKVDGFALDMGRVKGIVYSKER